MNGWYRQQRNLSERPWSGDAHAVQLYIFLKELAYVQDRMYKDVLIRRGSCVTTRPELMELTGMTRKKLDLTLRTLKSYGEILVKGYSKFSVVTICDYDSYNQSESLFGDTEGTTTEPTEGTTTEHTIYNKKEEIYKEDNLRSNFIPSKNEREKGKGLAYEIKAQYNRTFEGRLPEWKRLSDKMADKVAACVDRYGRQSVDMVFEQVLHEKFSMGDNTTGFIADFDFIFRLCEYEKYLSRYELRIRRGRAKMEKPVDIPEEPQLTEEPKQEKKFTRRDLVLSWISSYDANPTAYMASLLERCQASGELSELGIEWKPNKQQAI